ncbi:ribokinase [Pseudoxanthomonas sacheonensis]|uniref:Ribokinase n=1 Tax=Pseudoxanthomonas sacheonensis TaxID=443615 RepID=A0ABU1RM57_9GAMM|nr:ribokinase [Pseudoxanthomonas sacheonensis]MDR6839857.1 ribokinase [Pseudoxanthomonas sacheonensis]
MASVVVVGSFNVDHVWQCEALPAPGATISGSYASGPGGKGFNQAIAAARAGAETTFICALGDDPGGVLARALATANGVDLRDLASDQPTGTAGIYVDTHGRNTIVIGPGANASLTPAFVRSQDGAIAAAGTLLVQLESPGESVIAALELARAHGVVGLLNPAPANAATSIELLALADILTPNETEFAALVARHIGEKIEPDDVGATDGVSLHALCRELLAHGTVVVTLGSAGVFVSHAEDALRGDAKSHYRLAAEPAEAIDTTGAGDAFNGALAASLAGNMNPAFAEHVRFANRYAAVSTERTGAALAMPRLAEVAARFDIADSAP